MKSLPVMISFAAGLVLATVIGVAVVLPASRRAWQVNIDSDVHLPLGLAMKRVEHLASQGDCKSAAAQLRLLNKRLAEYRVGGPTPANWWNEGVTKPQPAP